MQARESTTTLARYVNDLPATARVDISVLQTIPVPGTRQFRIGELRKTKARFGRISNLGVSKTGVSLPGLKSQPLPTSSWNHSTRKFYVGKNSLEQRRADIWNQIWSTIPPA